MWINSKKPINKDLHVLFFLGDSIHIKGSGDKSFKKYFSDKELCFDVFIFLRSALTARGNGINQQPQERWLYAVVFCLV